MDLWIRSKDRMNLVQIKQISLNYQDSKQVIANYVPEQYENSSCFYELLGTYKTKERALEILDEIQDFIENRDTTKITQDIHGITSEVEIAKRVYNMPKE